MFDTSAPSEGKNYQLHCKMNGWNIKEKKLLLGNLYISPGFVIFFKAGFEQFNTYCLKIQYSAIAQHIEKFDLV